LIIRLLKSVWRGLRYYVVGLYNRAGEHHVFLMSGGLAFSLFVCSVPFALVLLAILGNLFDRPEILAKIFSLIDTMVPYSDQAEKVKNILSGRLSQITSVTEAAGIFGFIALIVTSTGLLSSLRTILAVVFRTGSAESVVIGKLWDFLLVMIILVLTVILTVSLPLLEAGLELGHKITWLDRSFVSGLDKVMINALSLVSLFLSFVAIYWLVPVRKAAWRTVFVSAAAATLLWLAAKELFGYYIGHAATLRHVYGVYTFLIVVAFWIYYSALVLILGAEIAQLYAEKREKRAKNWRP